MSYILDALRKSEEERAYGLRPDPAEPSAAATPSTDHRRWPAFLVIFLLLNVGLAGLLYWRNTSEPSVSPGGHATTEAPSIAAAPATPSAIPEVRADRQRNLHQELAAPGLRPNLRPDVRQTTPVAATNPAPRIAASPAVAPYLHELPLDLQSRLPALKIDIHVFTPGGQSILYINNREYRPGEQIQNGLRVEAIVQDGAVLSYNGQTFRLPRPR